MSPYPSYKDSGVEWIGQIPSEYSTIPIKHLIKNIIDNRGRTPDLEDEGIPYVEVKHVNKCGKHPTEKTTRFISKETYDNFLRKYLKEGDVLYTTVGTLGRTSIIPKDFYGCIIQNVVGFRINEKCLSTLFYYILNSKIGNHLIYDIVRGNIQGSVKVTDFIQQKIVIPPNNEQTQIVSFLDTKTQKIDELIEKTEQKIKLLKEKRTSLINHCVTKGLNPNVEMKDSGVEWIGEIPSNWEIVPLKFLGDFQNGIGKGSEFFGSGFPFMNYGDVYNNEITPISVDGKVQSDEIERERYSVLRGDVFFTRTSESKDDIGVSSVCLKTLDESVFSGFVIRFRFFDNSHIPEYSRYHFQTHWKKVFIESKMNIVTRSSLSQQVLGQLPVLIPSNEEQTQIVEYLDEKTQKIDSTIEKETQRIELLKEYRQSLISEVVTGKVDVRDWKE